MRRLKRFLSILLVSAMLMLPMAAFAVTPNPTVASPGYMVLTFHVSGVVLTGAGTGLIKFNMPFPARLITVQQSVAALAGAAPTVDVLVAGSSILTAVTTMTTAGIVYEALIATPTIADEAAVTVNLTTGTSMSNITIVMVLKRL